ncbi:HEPN domain-containing protein [Candidatus Woesearchaeota archaeon]|nr:HEPN domain-containing protein [Candidatus Woesearchaeota archaeon]
MNNIEWCLKQKNGIEIIEPNDDLAKAYIQKAEDALQASSLLEAHRDWRISSLYYSMYFAVYAILMKIGIKCEIHSCTITFMEEILKDYFGQKERELLKKSMKARIDTQYYTDKNISEVTYHTMVENAPKFLVTCKEILYQINEIKIKEIRNRISK